MHGPIELSPEVIAVLGGVLLTNLGALLSAYLSIRDRLTRIEVKVDILEKDINGVGGKLREFQSQTQQPLKGVQ